MPSVAKTTTAASFFMIYNKPKQHNTGVKRKLMSLRDSTMTSCHLRWDNLSYKSNRILILG